jgi:hypothetical protein
MGVTQQLCGKHETRARTQSMVNEKSMGLGARLARLVSTSQGSVSVVLGCAESVHASAGAPGRLCLWSAATARARASASGEVVFGGRRIEPVQNQRREAGRR